MLKIYGLILCLTIMALSSNLYAVSGKTIHSLMAGSAPVNSLNWGHGKIKSESNGLLHKRTKTVTQLNNGSVIIEKTKINRFTGKTIKSTTLTDLKNLSPVKASITTDRNGVVVDKSVYVKGANQGNLQTPNSRAPLNPAQMEELHNKILNKANAAHQEYEKSGGDRTAIPHPAIENQY